MTITTIKFFYNGIKINGEKNLIKLNVWKYEDGTIEIRDDWRLDKDFRQALLEIVDLVEVPERYYGDTETLRVRVNTDNPIYDCFKYMILAAKRKDLKKYGKDYTEIENEVNTLPNTATSADISAAKIYIRNTIENRNAIKKFKEEEEAVKRRATFDAERAEKETILFFNNLYPVSEYAKFKVRICWSEHPAFYDWDDNELILSVKAADAVFKALDKKPDEGGHYKTKFEIIEDGDVKGAYTGRYDLGDNDGGLLKHMESFAKCSFKETRDTEFYAARLEFIRALREDEEKTNDVTVKVADGLTDYIEFFKKNKEQ